VFSPYIAADGVCPDGDDAWNGDGGILYLRGRLGFDCRVGVQVQARQGVRRVGHSVWSSWGICVGFGTYPIIILVGLVACFVHGYYVLGGY
jgi:hypothetical protein